MIHYERNKRHGDPNVVIQNQKRKEQHGLSAHPLYGTWLEMRRRCRDKNIPSYRNYGGRGICVCQKWDASFTEFLKDVGNRPEGDYSLDRINNNGNYEPGNVRWATKKQQVKNRRKEMLIRGSRHALSKLTDDLVRDARLRDKNGATQRELAQRHGVSKTTIAAAINGKTWSHVT
jgi:hypothetical protein